MNDICEEGYREPHLKMVSRNVPEHSIVNSGTQLCTEDVQCNASQDDRVKKSAVHVPLVHVPITRNNLSVTDKASKHGSCDQVTLAHGSATLPPLPCERGRVEGPAPDFSLPWEGEGSLWSPKRNEGKGRSKLDARVRVGPRQLLFSQAYCLSC